MIRRGSWRWENAFEKNANLICVKWDAKITVMEFVQDKLHRWLFYTNSHCRIFAKDVRKKGLGGCMSKTDFFEPSLRRETNSLYRKHASGHWQNDCKKQAKRTNKNNTLEMTMFLANMREIMIARPGKYRTCCINRSLMQFKKMTKRLPGKPSAGLYLLSVFLMHALVLIWFNLNFEKMTWTSSGILEEGTHLKPISVNSSWKNTDADRVLWVLPKWLPVIPPIISYNDCAVACCSHFQFFLSHCSRQCRLFHRSPKARKFVWTSAGSNASRKFAFLSTQASTQAAQDAKCACLLTTR